MEVPVSEQAGESWRGRVGRMDAREIDEFFATGRICRLACLHEDGWPYIVPIWFQGADGGFFVIPRERSSLAGRLKRDGRVSLSIDEDEAPYRKVMVKGSGRTCSKNPTLVAVGWRSPGRYRIAISVSTAPTTWNRPWVSRDGCFSCGRRSSRRGKVSTGKEVQDRELMAKVSPKDRQTAGDH